MPFTRDFCAMKMNNAVGMVESVIAAANYNPLADDTPDSVFCSHGAGYTVPWNQVKAHAHCPVEE